MAAFAITAVTLLFGRGPKLAYNHGATAAHEGRHEVALESFHVAIRLNPNEPKSWGARGSVKASLGRMDEAIADFDEAIRLNPDLKSARVSRGNAMLNTGRYEDAIADYTYILKVLQPYNASVFLTRGLAFSRLENYSAAAADFSETIRLQPDSGAAYYYRGAMHFNMGMHLAALSDARKALQLAESTQNGVLVVDAEELIGLAEDAAR